MSEKVIRVFYKSKKNNKKVALAIAEEVGVTAESIESSGIQAAAVSADILFLGCAILGGNVPPEVDAFVEQLNKDNIQQIVLFSANGFGTDQFGPLREKLAAKGMNVAQEAFVCKGRGFVVINIGKPGAEELAAAKAFARKMMS